MAGTGIIPSGNIGKEDTGTGKEGSMKDIADGTLAVVTRMAMRTIRNTAGDGMRDNSMSYAIEIRFTSKSSSTSS